MAEPFLGEIRLMSFQEAPKYWAPCNGQLLPINQNQPLFALIGTRFGGNGQTNFALPDLRGRVPIHVADNRVLGTGGGEQAHTLSIAELPTHVHLMQAATVNSDDSLPGGKNLGSTANMYGPPTGLTTLTPSTVTNAGGS